MADSSHNVTQVGITVGPPNADLGSVVVRQEAARADLNERRTHLSLVVKPSVDDLVARLNVERQEVDRIGALVDAVEREQAKSVKHFESTLGGQARLWKKGFDAHERSIFWVKLLGVVGLVLVGIVLVLNLSSSSDISTAKSEAISAKTTVAEFKKATQGEVVKIKKRLDANKLDMDQLKDQIKVVGLKADKSVVTRMGEELKEANIEQDGRIQDIATAIMGKADIADLKSVRSAVAQVRRANGKVNTKMTRLEAQVLELKAQLQAQQPKTM